MSDLPEIRFSAIDPAAEKTLVLLVQPEFALGAHAKSLDKSLNGQLTKAAAAGRFTLQDRALRRAGLDYADLAHVSVHRDLAACLASLRGARATGPRLYAIETGSARPYSAAAFQPGDALLFGPETRGLPANALAHASPQSTLSIPMRPGNRSLNLANAVALVVYEAWRQTGFA